MVDSKPKTENFAALLSVVPKMGKPSVFVGDWMPELKAQIKAKAKNPEVFPQHSSKGSVK
jgi:hypothetical protein